MRKSVKREYELDRSYDYVESLNYGKRAKTTGQVKKRAHKRLRKQILYKELMDSKEEFCYGQD